MTIAPPATDDIVVADPTTGALASSVRRATEDEVREAVARARAAARAWARTAPAERGALLHRAAEHVRAHAQELADLNTRETGKGPRRRDRRGGGGHRDPRAVR
ncbi:aldehyde dehydrogenase family protein, partial [Curtobacterium sp. B18]|uniref:aldehyde dehydrogenase family protein n=1 Tax=Curtobacterium sp. B18 TaxID=95614 RepID=UPI0004CF0E68